MKPARGCPGRWQERPGDWVSWLECVELAGIPAEETFLWGLNPEWPADGNYEQRSARKKELGQHIGETMALSRRATHSLASEY